MNPASKLQALTDQQNQRLIDFIYELNIARRNLSLYPPEHPRIAISHKKALELLHLLLEQRGELHLGVAPEALMLDQQWLDKENRTFQDFAGFLYSLGIAVLGFSRGITFAQLFRLNQLLRSEREVIDACGGYSELLRQQQIDQVEITPIDYAAFQRSDSSQAAELSADKSHWENFLQGLLTGNLDVEGTLFNWPEQLDPTLVAEVLNQRLTGETVPGRQEQVADTFVSRMLQSGSELPQAQRPIQQLPLLLAKLTPELRQSFLDSTFEELDQQPDNAETLLSNFPKDLLLETLEKQSQQQMKISSRLLKLVQRLSAEHGPLLDKHPDNDQPLEKDIIRARLDVLFSEEDHDLYMPSSYQGALRDILDEDLSKIIPEERKLQLKASIEAEEIERQCCGVIFEMLENRVSLEAEAALQRNLLELSRFFLDTGDFATLREIYQSWADFLHSGRSTATIFDEQVLANHTQLSFIVEVLDGIELWGKEKASELIDYVAVVGGSYSEPLIERLANEPKRALRWVWMECLERIGADATQMITEALNDERWYLVRNLLVVLGQQPESPALKIVHQFIDHPHPRVRQEAMRLLFRVNPATANRQLLKELSSQNPDNLQAAAQVADLSQDPAVLFRLHELLQKKISSDLDLEVRIQFLSCLARIGHETSLTVLRKLLSQNRLFLNRRQKRFQQEIILSIARFPYRLAEPFLQQLASGRQGVLAKLARQQLLQLQRIEA